jgi:hypothetical protein
MRSTTQRALPDKGPERISGDRRRDRRYEIVLDTQWKLIRRRKVLDGGSGRTVDVSSGGVLIETGRPLPVGLNLEVSIAWPVLLHNAAPLQLVVAGRIVRSQGNLVAIRTVQHEFRTAGASGKQGAALPPEARTPLAFVNKTRQAVSPRPN